MRKSEAIAARVSDKDIAIIKLEYIEKAARYMRSCLENGQDATEAYKALKDYYNGLAVSIK